MNSREMHKLKELSYIEMPEGSLRAVEADLERIVTYCRRIQTAVRAIGTDPLKFGATIGDREESRSPRDGCPGDILRQAPNRCGCYILAPADEWRRCE